MSGCRCRPGQRCIVCLAEVYGAATANALMSNMEAAVEQLLPVKPTIPLRIRVGVTADGKWSAIGHCRIQDGNDPIIAGAFPGDPVVAWHWITAEVPMPEVEHGEVKGTVEP